MAKIKINFVSPDIHKLDTIVSDAVSLCLYDDDWPLKNGIAPLIDWRLNGYISHLKEIGWITSQKDEKILFPLNGRFPFEKLLLIGMGKSSSCFELKDVESALCQIFTSLPKLQIHSTVLEIPGRFANKINPIDAVNLLLNVYKKIPEQDEIILVDNFEAQKIMEEQLTTD